MERDRDRFVETETMGEETPLQMHGDLQGQRSSEETIFVSVRLRPLNENEIVRNGESDWECINKNTIVFKHSMPERSMFPAAYTFGKHIFMGLQAFLLNLV